MAKKESFFNPFSLTSYMGAEYFCDRQKETEELHRALYNGRNVTLSSPRRMGKTGLIRHLFQQIPAEEAQCFYVDIYHTKNMYDFTKAFAEAVIAQRMIPFAERVGKEILHFFSSLRPVFTPDPISGGMQCTVDIQPYHEEMTLQQIFAYLEQTEQRCYVAFDEFQEIADYTDGFKGKAEALLRTYVQQCHNVHFIFAGSKKHLMAEMFLSAKRPFFQSTQLMSIDAIDESSYYQFASHHLTAHKQHMDAATFHELYALVNGHTWYMQALLNRIYQNGVSEINIDDVHIALNQWLEENAPAYNTYCRLITDRQLAVMRAVAKEGTVKEFGKSAFLQRYQLGAYSTVRSAVVALDEKELLYHDSKGNFSVYDRFFGLWLQRQF